MLTTLMVVQPHNWRQKVTGFGTRAAFNDDTNDQVEPTRVGCAGKRTLILHATAQTPTLVAEIMSEKLGFQRKRAPKFGGNPAMEDLGEQAWEEFFQETSGYEAVVVIAPHMSGVIAGRFYQEVTGEERNFLFQPGQVTKIEAGFVENLHLPASNIKEA